MKTETKVNLKAALIMFIILGLPICAFVYFATPFCHALAEGIVAEGQAIKPTKSGESITEVRSDQDSSLFNYRHHKVSICWKTNDPSVWVDGSLLPLDSAPHSRAELEHYAKSMIDISEDLK